jgi:hypothetical protein
MKKTIENVTRVLADWNPIGVPENIASDEYRDYVPMILNALENKENLMKVLEDILINKMELEYDPKNREHLEDLRKVCEKLLLCAE